MHGEETYYSDLEKGWVQPLSVYSCRVWWEYQGQLLKGYGEIISTDENSLGEIHSSQHASSYSLDAAIISR